MLGWRKEEGQAVAGGEVGMHMGRGSQEENFVSSVIIWTMWPRKAIQHGSPWIEKSTISMFLLMCFVRTVSWHVVLRPLPSWAPVNCKPNRTLTLMWQQSLNPRSLQERLQNAHCHPAVEDRGILLDESSGYISSPETRYQTCISAESSSRPRCENEMVPFQNNLIHFIHRAEPRLPTLTKGKRYCNYKI